MRNRNRDEQQRPSPAGEASGVGDGSTSGEALRLRARRLLDEGDETIRNALSQNSERFLAQNRQQGGQ